MGSTPGNFANGKTGDLMQNLFTERSLGRSKSESFRPAITSAAILAIGTPVALETKGTVRDARGFTSNT